MIMQNQSKVCVYWVAILVKKGKRNAYRNPRLALKHIVILLLTTEPYESIFQPITTYTFYPLELSPQHIYIAAWLPTTTGHTLGFCRSVQCNYLRRTLENKNA